MRSGMILLVVRWIDAALRLERSLREWPPRLFVVFLAFANAEGDLPELREETRQLQELFEGFAREGPCELIFRPNATLDQIYQLTSYRDRIVLFHYGGHADSGRLCSSPPLEQPRPMLRAWPACSGNRLE